jgi:hypothetical protein
VYIYIHTHALIFFFINRFLIEGARRTGQMIDNWADVTLLVIQEVVLPGTSPKCADSPSSTLNIASEQRDFFGSNTTVVVGLTETMFALTDGWSVIYYSTAKGSVQSEIAHNSWSIPIDVRMGVAAVQYGDGNEQRDDTSHGKTTSMMGCRFEKKCVYTLQLPARWPVPSPQFDFQNTRRCDDSTTKGISITCAILEYDPSIVETNSTINSVQRTVFPVDFQVCGCMCVYREEQGAFLTTVYAIRCPARPSTFHPAPRSRSASKASGGRTPGSLHRKDPSCLC